MYNKKTLPQIKAKIDRMLNNSNSKVRAIASVTIGDSFAVHGVRVVESQKGCFVQMPQTSYEKDGTRHYNDIIHPVSTEAREKLGEVVLNAYNQRLAEVQQMTSDPDDEELPFGPAM